MKDKFVVETEKKERPDYNALAWTGTRRISKSHIMDEFGEVFSEREFTQKIGVKDGVLWPFSGITSVTGVAGDGTLDLYHIVGPGYTIFRTNYDRPNWSRDFGKQNF